MHHAPNARPKTTILTRTTPAQGKLPLGMLTRGILPAALLVAASLLALAAGCARPRVNLAAIEHPSSSTPIATILDEQSAYSEGLSEEMVFIVNSARDLDSLWRLVYAGRTPVPETPLVNWARESVVIATLGMRGSGGYGVSIDSVSEIPEGMRITLTASAPGETCMVTEALTTPVQGVRVRKLPGVVMFDWRRRVVECE